MKDFYDKLVNILDEAVQKEYDVKLEAPLWELPSKQEFGDLSTMAAMKLASSTKQDPLAIAERLKGILDKELSGIVEKIEILKPAFINIFFSRKIIFDSLSGVLNEKDKFFRRDFKRKVLIEFCSANPTGPISIAHGRQAVVGDAIANILKFCGNGVEKEYYVNDEGNQIDLLVESVAQRIKEIKGEPFAIPEGGYVGEYIKNTAQAYLNEGALDLREFTLAHMLNWIKKDLASAGIDYDNWQSQKKIMQECKVAAAVELLRSKGLLYDKEEALWFSSTKFGDDKDRVIRKENGDLTYFAYDIAYHRDKIVRGFDLLINLWGPDHHGYINRVKSAIEALGYSRDILHVIIMQLVTLKSKEKMSKRKGTAILFSELREDVGKDAARYFYLTRRNSSILEFDIDLAKEASVNNPLFYAQYACARIESIFQKAQGQNFTGADISKLDEAAEINLVRAILQFSFAVEKAYYTYEPVFIVEYLKVLAASFHKFYETTRVIVDDQELTRARLNLIAATKTVLHCALNLLGITPVQKM
jgi:arginyl-tRNA synthetase